MAAPEQFTFPACVVGDDYGPYAVRLEENDGTVFDTTGVTAKCQVRDKFATESGSTVLLTLCNGAAASGLFYLSAANAATLTQAPMDAVCDFQTTDAGGLVRTWFQGTFPIVADVTR